MYNFHKKEAPLLGLLGSGGGLASRLTGSAAASPYVDDLFSTYLYDGNGSDRTITNGIDLAGEGGIVWTKCRNDDPNNQIDYIEGTTRYSLNTDLANGAGIVDLTNPSSYSSDVDQYNSDGYRIKNGGANTNATYNSRTYVSWTFRKAPGFFDVVRYTGNGVAGREIAHSLGSTPGMVIVKRTNGGDNWTVQHRSLGGTKSLYLNLTNDEDISATEWNNTAATSTVFTVGTSGKTNALNDTYIAYVFAHDDQSFGTNGDEAIIKCGSYSGTGVAGNTVDIGFEPQFLLVKSAIGGTGDWRIIDHMRGFANTNLSSSSGGDATLNANTNELEFDCLQFAQFSSYAFAAPTATGFTLEATSGPSNASGRTYIYMAIRRPNKPPEAATEVFDTVQYTGNNTTNNVANSMLYTDLVWIKRHSSDKHNLTDRLRGNHVYTSTSVNSSDQTWNSGEYIALDQHYSTGRVGNVTGYNNSNGQLYSSWNFKRAPGFFDIVSYAGTGSNHSVAHNLTVPPELLIVKTNSHSDQWAIYAEPLGASKKLGFDQNDAGGVPADYWQNTTPDANYFYLGSETSVNQSGRNFLAYLFATLPGISKVGSYTGTGNDINIDCGFTNGARFVLIKRTDYPGGLAGHWHLYDSANRILTGNDNYFQPNVDWTLIGNEDNIDPLSSGFTVASTATSEVNASGGTYLFLAIA